MPYEQSTIEFLSYLRTLNIRLSLKGDKLSCTAPTGVLTPALAAELKDRKPEIMVLLRENAGRQLPPLVRLGQREYPPSAGQRQLWFLDRFDPESAAYNISFALRINGAIDPPMMERAACEMIERHEVLRTAIVEVDGAPLARISNVGFTLDNRSVEELPESERESRVKQILYQESRVRFDLARPPLLRVCLIRVRADEYVLGVATHHIAADGFSLRIFCLELLALYDAFLKGLPSPLAELPVQYSDYANWRTEHLERERLATEIRYWKEKLHEPLPVTEMPFDHPRPAKPTSKGSRIFQMLPPEVFEEVRRFSHSVKTTPFVTLLTAFYLLLARYTRQTDLIVGSASAGRGQPEIEGLIGLFIHNLVLRVNLEGDPTVTELIDRVRETVLGAFSNENVPLERLIETTQAQRDTSRPPLFQTMFVYQNTVGPRTEVSGLAWCTPLIFDTGTSRYDLTVEAAEWDNQVLLVWEYSSELFEASTIERFQRHYRTLLENLIRNPQRAISTLDVLTEEERSELVQSAVLERSYRRDLCVHQWIEEQCAATPDAIAVTFEGQSITYRELDRRSAVLSRHLRSLGVGPEVLVGVLLERSIDLVVALFATLRAGGAYVPLDPSFPKDRTVFMLEDSKASVLITQESLSASAAGSQATTVCLDRLPAQDDSASSIPLPSGVGPENRAYVIYTSGSTGTPKGVEVVHGALTNFLFSMQQEPGMTPSDRLLAVTTPSFDIAGLEFYLPLVSGARVVIAPRFAVTDGAALWRLLENEQITVMQATPVTWRLLLEAGWPGAPGLKKGFKILCGGEMLGRELANRLLETGGEVWNLYGPTETTIWSSLHRLEPGADAVPIGRPIANTRLYILDEHFQPAPRGAIGELFIAGDGLARGYLERPELTASRFLEDPFRPGNRMYRTGDLARMLPGDLIECMGRVDHQVKLRGHRIELGEIEAVLERQPEVRQAVVIVREDSAGDQRLTAYIVSREGKPLDAETLREPLRGKLPDYMVPGAYVFLDKFPLTANGKVDRKALPAPDAPAARSSKYAPPRTESEKQVAAVWQTLLKNPNIGIHENFFDLGGHSLLVIQLQARLRRQFGWEPSLIELFQYPTVSSIARLMDQANVAAAVGD